MRRAVPSANTCIAARLLRLLAVLLVLAGQLTNGARAAAQDDQARKLLAFDSALVLCQPGHAKGQPRAPAPHMPLYDLAILQEGTATHAALLAATPTLPTPVQLPRGRAGTPQQARAPPAYYAQSAFPRGPPGSV